MDGWMSEWMGRWMDEPESNKPAYQPPNLV